MHTIQGYGNGLPLSARQPIGLAKRFTVAAAGLLERVLIWHDRAAQRRALEQLTEHQLKDVGLSRADADREAMKRFWQE